MARRKRSRNGEAEDAASSRRIIMALGNEKNGKKALTPRGIALQRGRASRTFQQFSSRRRSHPLHRQSTAPTRRSH